MLISWLQRDLSLDEWMEGKHNRSPDVPFADPGIASQEQTIYRKELAELVRKALGHLDVRERHVIEHRFGLSGGEERSLGDIAAGLCISRERVRQIELRAKTKLRADLIGCAPFEVSSCGPRSMTAC